MIRCAILGCLARRRSRASSTISLTPSTERLSSGVSSRRPRSYKAVIYGNSPSTKMSVRGSTGKDWIGEKNVSGVGRLETAAVGIANPGPVEDRADEEDQAILGFQLAEPRRHPGDAPGDLARTAEAGQPPALPRRSARD